MPHRIDLARSRIAIRTGTTGLFSAVAHDLEIEARELRGEADLDGDAPHGWIECPLRSLRVVGVVRRGRVETNVLSSGDVGDIERRVRTEVLPMESVRIEADTRQLTVHGPRAKQTLTWRPDRRDEAGAVTFAGETPLSLTALGVGVVKGPLGAFKVADAVRVIYRVTWIA
jgi:hypothetical protein